MLQAKNTQSRTQLVLQVFCFAVFTFSNAVTHAEMHQCSGPDGSKIFSDQPCPDRGAANNGGNNAANDTANKDAAIKAAQKAAAAAREAVVGKGNSIKSNAIKNNAVKSKPTSETVTMPTRPSALPPTTKADVVPTTQDLEEQAIEQAAFSASLFVHVIESLDPACQKMMLDLNALEKKYARSGSGEPSAEQKTMHEAWEANCQTKAKAASESYPPPARVNSQSLFGNSPRCLAWVRSLAAKSKLGNSPDMRSTTEMQSDMRRECR
jgi:hypothetical protein